ncbi:MAG: hypothetical protein IPJ89_00885 [Candidatus Iainarchaeum archaeon]|uniref:Uncharacterized protein n=1 Tax=Candidatus Iainarchaeum sp. TaxID=3101447 RepID=A0A7T9DK26_9ARCH|nr:MAG: hypothetical protein IPJ89_00885 [Candidatus Diapherotrites archaeon]
MGRERFGQEIVADIEKEWKWVKPGTYPEAHDKIKFKIVKNKLILPGIPGLNWLANRSQKWWKKIFYAEGIHVELVKE